MWALIVAGVVQEVTDIDPTGRFHEDLVWVACGEDVRDGWSFDGSAFTAPPLVEPTIAVAVLSMRQAKLQLSRAGLLDAANTAIGTMSGQEGEEARIEWEYATELRRDHPLVEGIGEALELKPEDIDGLFAEAAKIG